LTQPKGGLFIDAGMELDAVLALKSINVIQGNNVPDAMQGVISGLTAEDKQQLTAELLSLWKK
jgi:hypothetical protein